jgi:hypothetical protein
MYWEVLFSKQVYSLPVLKRRDCLRDLDIDHREINYVVLDWIEPASVRIHWRAFLDPVIKFDISWKRAVSWPGGNTVNLARPTERLTSYRYWTLPKYFWGYAMSSVESLAEELPTTLNEVSGRHFWLPLSIENEIWWILNNDVTFSRTSTWSRLPLDWEGPRSSWQPRDAAAPVGPCSWTHPTVAHVCGNRTTTQGK